MYAAMHTGDQVHACLKPMHTCRRIQCIRYTGIRVYTGTVYTVYGCIFAAYYHASNATYCPPPTQPPLLIRRALGPDVLPPGLNGDPNG